MLIKLIINREREGERERESERERERERERYVGRNQGTLFLSCRKAFFFFLFKSLFRKKNYLIKV